MLRSMAKLEVCACVSRRVPPPAIAVNAAADRSRAQAGRAPRRRRSSCQPRRWQGPAHRGPRRSLGSHFAARRAAGTAAPDGQRASAKRTPRPRHVRLGPEHWTSVTALPDPPGSARGLFPRPYSWPLEHGRGAKPIPERSVPRTKEPPKGGSKHRRPDRSVGELQGCNEPLCRIEGRTPAEAGSGRRY
jgi:hypothetical protein